MVKPFAQLAALDHLPRENERGHPPVVVANHVYDPRFVHGRGHALHFGDVAGERLFTEDGFACRRRRERNRGVGVVRRADVDDVDFRVVHDRAPVSFALFPAEGRRRLRERTGGRPQRVFIRRPAVKAKNRDTCRQALECALPMNL